jgi:hypothetical protein
VGVKRERLALAGEAVAAGGRVAKPLLEAGEGLAGGQGLIVSGPFVIQTTSRPIAATNAVSAFP